MTDPFTELQCKHDKPKKDVTVFGRIPSNLCDECMTKYAALGVELRQEAS